MQIVIDIPEEIKKKRDAGKVLSSEEITTVCLAIKNGTLLPKGHGDLIDRSKLVPDCEEQEIHDGEDWRNDYCGVSLMQIEHYTDVIIPATKENNK